MKITYAVQFKPWQDFVAICSYECRYLVPEMEYVTFSVIKRMLNDNARLVMAKAQNNELKFRMIAYNTNTESCLFLHSEISTRSMLKKVYLLEFYYFTVLS